MSTMHEHMELPQKPRSEAESLAKGGALGWWYRLAAFHLPDDRLPTLKDQEIIRRSRLASFVLVVQLLLIEAPVIPVVAAAPNHGIVLPWLLGCIGILLAAFACNRLGKLTIAGLLMVASIEITVIIKMLTIPGGVGVVNLPQFDILIQPVLLAVVLLPPWSAFAVAGFNIGFILSCLFAGPHAPDLTMALHNPTVQGDILAVPVMAQFIIATVAYLIVANLLSALKRASAAEQIAALEHDLAASRATEQARTQALEDGVRAILDCIQRVSQRDYQARIVLEPRHELAPVAMQFNNFFQRYQRAHEAEIMVEAMNTNCQLWADEIYAARQAGRQWRVPLPHQTPLDLVLNALVGTSSGNGRPGKSHSGSLTQPPH